MRNNCSGDAMRAALVLLALCGVMRPASAQDARAQERMAFWNLTSSTITELALAPAGAEGAAPGPFGANQCANDRDGAVDHDERLRLQGITPGRYDVRLATKPSAAKPARTCTVRGVEVKGGGKYAFSLSDSDLVDCR